MLSKYGTIEMLKKRKRENSTSCHCHNLFEIKFVCASAWDRFVFGCHRKMRKCKSLSLLLIARKIYSCNVKICLYCALFNDANIFTNQKSISSTVWALLNGLDRKIPWKTKSVYCFLNCGQGLIWNFVFYLQIKCVCRQKIHTYTSLPLWHDSATQPSFSMFLR